MSSIQENPPAAAIVEEPYVGLTHFTEDYADRFFGRERESDVIIGNLQAARLTLLYAESGVGKSSVLRAGVVAYLRELADDLRDPGALHLAPVVFSAWSERPVAELIGEIGRTVGPHLDRPEELELPENDLAGALEAAGKALDATILVILDQFEEYFLYPDEAPEQERIAAQVARCVNRPDLRANFLISIREDSYARLGDLFRGKVRNVYGNFLHLDFLDRAGGREAIEGPIDQLNEKLPPEGERFKVEPPLIDAVLSQVKHDEDEDKIETTYLQLVMRRLWEEERKSGSRVLRLQTLERLGGAQKIISDHLDRAMEGGADGSAALDDEQRLVAAKVFRHLVTSGGAKIALTARELADYTEIPVEKIELVLRHLSSSQLHILRPVVSGSGEGEQRFEIFHDALAVPINSWRAQIEDKERERERVEKEEAQRAAARAERRARVAQVLLAVAVVALIAGAVFFAIEQKNLADQREADNQSVRAAERIAELGQTPTFGSVAAALAGVEDYGLAPTVEARNQILAQLELNPGLPKITSGHTREVDTVAYFPGGSDFVSGAADRTVRLWSGKGRELRSPLHVPSAVVGLTVSRPASDGGRILAAGLSSGSVVLWRVDDGRRVRRLPPIRIDSGELWGLAFNPRLPDMLAVGSTEGSLTLWSLKDPRHPVRLAKRHVPAVNNLAFAADGRSLLVAGEKGGEALGVSSKGFTASVPVKKVSSEEEAVATAPDGSYAFGGKGGIEAWDASRGRWLHLRQQGTIDTLAFAREGSVLVSGGTDWNVMTWDMASGRSFGPPRTFDRAAAVAVAVSPDERTILAGGEDALLKRWPLHPALALASTVGSLPPDKAGHLPEIPDLAVGEGGRVVAATGPTGTSLWSLRNPDPGSLPKPLAQIPGASNVVAYRGDILVTGRGSSFAVYGTGAACHGKHAPCLLAVPRQLHTREPIFAMALVRYGRRLLLASSGRQGSEGVDLWDLSDVTHGGGITHLAWRRVESPVYRLAFSPVDPLLAIGAEDGELRVWDVGDPRKPKEIEVGRLLGSESQPIAAVAFSPDGSWLASGGEDQQVVLWRVAYRGAGAVSVDATPGAVLQGQSIFSLAFSPDGKTLAVGDAEGNTCLYEVVTQHPIGGGSCLLGHKNEGRPGGGIAAAEFAQLPSGEAVLLTAGAGQPVVAWKSILWSLSGDGRIVKDLTAAVCRLSGRDLEMHEWRAIFESTNLEGGPRLVCSE